MSNILMRVGHVVYLLAFLVSVWMSMGLWTLPVVLVSLYLIDLASGLTHILLDDDGFLKPHHLEACKRLVKNDVFDDLNGFTRVVYDFQLHHYNPRLILSTGFYTNEVVGHALKMSFVPFLVVNVVCWATSSHLVGLFFNTFFAVGIHAQLIHQFSHMRGDERPWVATVLQKLHVFMPSRFHVLHHAPPHHINFGIVNGWSGPLLNLAFPGIKKAVVWLRER